MMKFAPYQIGFGVIVVAGVILVQFVRFPAGEAAVFSSLAWPTVACFAIYAFRGEIKSLIQRLTAFKTPLFSMDSSSTSGAVSEQDKAAAVKIDRTKPTNIYWLASDLMQFIYKVTGGAEKMPTLFSIQHAVHHLKQVGLAETSAYRRLSVIRDEAERLDDSEWTPERRNKWGNEAWNISNEIGSVFKETQPDFDGG